MKTSPDTLLNFKTDIGKVCENCAIHKTLSNHPGIKLWSIDHEDVDRILCLYSQTLSAQEVIALVRAHGHYCEELN